MDKDFYDKQLTNPKILNHFIMLEYSEFENSNKFLPSQKNIVIETPDNCSILQINIT